MKKLIRANEYMEYSSSLLRRLRLKNMYVLLFLLSLLLSSSCVENNVEHLNSNSLVIASSPYHIYLTKKLKNESKIVNRNGNYSISEAEEYLNDGLNYLYCRPTDYFAETEVFIDTFRVSLNSEEISENDLLILMEDIAEFAGDNFYADNRTTKAPFMFYIHRILSLST